MSNFAHRILAGNRVRARRILAEKHGPARRILASTGIDEIVGKIMLVKFERVKPEGRAKEAYRTTINPSNIKDQARRLKNRLGFTSALKLPNDPKATLVPGTLRLASSDKKLTSGDVQEFVKVYFVKSGLVYLTFTGRG